MIGSFLSWSVGHEAVEGEHAGDFRQLFQLGDERLRRVEVRRQNVDRIRRRIVAVREIVERHHRLGVLGAQVQRIEVEAQVREQRRAGKRDRQRADDDGIAMLGEELVDRRQEFIADRASCSAGGFSTVNSAGRTVTDEKKAMIMPVPAMSPSSETPR